MYKISPRQSMIALMGVGIIFRMILGGKIGLGVDESYVVAIARTFSLSYFDHPPLHFWIVWLTTHLTHSENGLILRMPFILLFAGTTWMMYRLGSKLFGEWAGVYAALAMNISAVFGLSTGSWILPDGPLMFFMLATVLVLTRLFFSPGPKPAWLWVVTGMLLGLGLLSKYHAIFIAFGCFVFLATSRSRRSLLLTTGPYTALTAARKIGIFSCSINRRLPTNIFLLSIVACTPYPAIEWPSAGKIGRFRLRASLTSILARG